MYCIVLKNVVSLHLSSANGAHRCLTASDYRLSTIDYRLSTIDFRLTINILYYGIQEINPQ